MSIRLDDVIFSTLHEPPRNYATKSANANISGNIGSLGVADFILNIPYERAGTRADIYLVGNGSKVLANGGSRVAGAVYQSVSMESFSVLVTYTPSEIAVILSIFNGTGGSINLVPQTISVLTVLYDMPITSV